MGRGVSPTRAHHVGFTDGSSFCPELHACCLLWSLPGLQHWSDNQYQALSWPTASPFCVLSLACGNKDGSSFANTVSNLGGTEKGAKIYFGSSFKGFSPWWLGPVPHRLVLVQTIMAKGVQGGTKFCGSQEAKRALLLYGNPFPDPHQTMSPSVD